MKCPFRSIMIYEPERTNKNQKYWAKDRIEYPDCYEEECPYFDSQNMDCLRVRKPDLLSSKSWTPRYIRRPNYDSYSDSYGGDHYDKSAGNEA